MAYERVNWENLPSTNTPVNADNLNKMDAGIAEIDEKMNAKQDKLTAGTGIEITGTNIINNLNENYSTNEQKIGKWIDGKPLYRKVIIWSENDYIQQNTVMSLAHGISNLNEVIKCNGMVKWSNIFMPMTTHYQNQQNEIAINTIDNNNINFTSYNENWGATRIVFILEYTKSTD